MAEETLTENVDMSADSFEDRAILYGSSTEAVVISADDIETWAALDGTISELVMVSWSVDLTRVVPVLTVDGVDLSLSVISGGSFNVINTEQLSITSKVAITRLAAIVESIAMAGSTAAKKRLASEIKEIIIGDCSLESQLSAVATIVNTLIMADFVIRGKGAAIVEQAEFGVSTQNRLIAVAEKLEQVVIEESLTNSLMVSAAISDGIDVDSTVEVAAVLRGLIGESINFKIAFDNDGYHWTGWCMNADNFGVSSYGDYPFNSFAKIGGKYYGANANGLYLLEGDSDDGEAISAKAMLAATDCDKTKQGTIRDAWLGLRSDGEVFVKVVADDNRERWYRAQATNEHLGRTRVKIARGIKSNYWQVGLENIDGADFELSNIELVHVVLSRH